MSHVDAEGWKLRWQQGQTPFHESEPNANLLRHWDAVVSSLGGAVGGGLTVLVPLCGASKDLVWLAARPEVRAVVGVELCELALERLLQENPQLGELARSDLAGGGRVYSSSDSKLFFCLTDFFDDALLSEFGDSFDVVWDRSALVAVNVGDRPRYCHRLRRLVQRSRHAMLVEVFDYDIRQFDGPPHSVDESQLRELLPPAAYDLRCLSSDPWDRFAAHGLSQCSLRAWLAVASSSRGADCP